MHVSQLSVIQPALFWIQLQSSTPKHVHLKYVTTDAADAMLPDTAALARGCRSCRRRHISKTTSAQLQLHSHHR